MSLKNVILISALVATSLYVQSQVKYEREFRIKEHEAPPLAISFVDSVFSESRVRWYAEISHEGKSIEAKVNHNRKMYSIEFDLQGAIIDVEIEIKEQEIPEAVLQNIKHNLRENFDRYRIARIQEQLIAPRYGHYQFLKNGLIDGITTMNFEMTIKGTKNRKTGWFEFLFDNEGQIISKMPVVFRNTDNLEF